MTQAKYAQHGVIYQAPVSQKKIYIREQKGLYQAMRRYLNLVLLVVFVGMPFLQFDGRQAILIDLAQQQLYLLGWILFPQDLPVLGLLFIIAAFALFYMTNRLGRVWCGFSCPQTVWTLMFNWVERRIEGSHHHSRALDKGPNTRNKLAKKTIKHGIWLLLSLLTALAFLAYFVPATSLYSDFFTLQTSALVTGWVLFFSACTYINAGWIREKMCQHMCPYARFQAVMFDKTTQLVTYDRARGEQRGPRKRRSEHQHNLGDCVDCGLCVQVCPVGIDIRQGLQYECINCGLCADACNSVMDKFGYARGLIRFASEDGKARLSKQGLGYAIAAMLAVLAMVGWGLQRSPFEVSVNRDRQALYRINSQGDVENTYVVKVVNKTPEPQTYGITIQGMEGLYVLGSTELSVGPAQQREVALSVGAQSHLLKPSTELEFVLQEAASGSSITKETVFLAGEGAW